MASWRENLRKVTPYTPGEQPKVKNIIKLNTNENPFPPSPFVQEVIHAFQADCNKLYPDPDCTI